MLLPLILILSAVTASAKHLPPDVEVCHRSDPEFGQCFGRSVTNTLKKFADGYPDLGVSRLEPFLIEKLDVNDGNTGTVSLQQHYENIQIYGQTTIKISNVSANLDKDNCFISFDAAHPELWMESDYRITGKVLLFPVNGHGKCKNIFKKVKAQHQLKCEMYEKKNQKTYLRITEHLLDWQPEMIHYDFENAIDGNPQLSAEVLKTINENAQSVFQDVKGGFNQAFSLIFKQLLNNVMSRVPFDELFPQ